jgi:hypothetical protein
MKKTRLNFLWLFLKVALCSAPIGAKADFFWQPPSSPIESEWRNAGSLFLEGIAQTLNGMAGFEGKDIASAKSEMAKASASLLKARDLYSNVQSKISAPRRVALDKIPPDRLRFIQGLFENYKMKLPSDERQAAEIAGAQALQLANRLQSDKERFASYEFQDFRALVGEVTGALQIGADTTELLKYGLEEK